MQEFVLPRMILNANRKEVIEALAKWHAQELTHAHSYPGAPECMDRNGYAI
jgi:hypothetical protein